VNGDGKISKDEAPPRLAQNFDRFDIDKDGFISLREFRAGQSGGPGGQGAPRPTPEETFKRLDVNGDGKISKDEAPPRLAQNFDRFDIDKDGFISLREFRAGQSGGPGGQGVPRVTPEETFKRLDVNGDGKISKDEAPPRLVQSFDRFDIDKDGFISLREFQAARAAAPENPDRPQRPRASGNGQ
jgi:collagen type III alpha